MILSLAIAVNERNNASSELESAASDEERTEALSLIESARFHSHRLRALMLDHFQMHGC
ncbi:MAG TPA: hypothetical protein VGH38_01690 [Bryobacteraceae bacterium]